MHVMNALLTLITFQKPNRPRRYSSYAMVLGVCLGISASSASIINAAEDNAQLPWQQLQNSGENQDVYFHTWGGDPQINTYIQWAAAAVEDKYNIHLIHVKLSDTSEAVSRVLAEKSANNDEQGSVDLIWINGANFATMSENSLLLKDWANHLPNFALTDPKNNPAVTLDFGVPTKGMEAPWG